MRLSRKKVNMVLAKRQWTLSVLSRRCGISRNRLYVILNSCSVTPKTVGKISSALAVEPEEILEEVIL